MDSWFGCQVPTRRRLGAQAQNEQGPAIGLEFGAADIRGCNDDAVDELRLVKLDGRRTQGWSEHRSRSLTKGVCHYYIGRHHPYLRRSILLLCLFVFCVKICRLK